MEQRHREIKFRKATADDTRLIKELMDRYWGGEPLIIRGKDYYPSALPGIIVEGDHGQIEAFLFYEIKDRAEDNKKECEIVVFEVLAKFNGTGTMILNQFLEMAKNNGCSRIFLMTTNDNLDALRFYQRRGFTICGIHLNSVAAARKVKPKISLLGDYNIPVRDEIDLELLL
ncbi:MAG: GNAT family N-acetyltransferase [Oligoflexia bacterium]|nr:GNAT family N-acetyltransferase [Oligoflexia bacterium]